MEETHDADWRVVLEPEVRVRELLDLLAGHAHRLHDLELVLQPRRLRRDLALLRLVHGFCGAVGRRRGRRCRRGVLIWHEPFEVFAEQFDLAFDFVRRRLPPQCILFTSSAK